MMRRIVVLAILIVLLATLLNLAIALGFWWFGERPPAPSIDNDYGIVDLRPQELAVWRDKSDSDWPDEPAAATMHNYLGITRRSLVWIESEWSLPLEDPATKITKHDSYSIYIVELGWPMRCVAGEQWNEWHGPGTQRQVTSGMFKALGAQWPNRVIWPGMIVNELFYCTVIVLSFVGWIQGRRAVRRRRGRCPQCAYDLRGDLSSGCPECGQGRERA